VRRQLGPWVLAYHAHEPRRRARELAATLPPSELATALAEIYAVNLERADEIVRSLHE